MKGQSTSRWTVRRFAGAGAVAVALIGCTSGAKPGGTDASGESPADDTAADLSDDSGGETGDSGSDTGVEQDPPATPVQFGLPLEGPDAFDGRVGVDHDPAVYSGIERLICIDYMERPFPHCYDEHDGTDIILDGGFTAMDAGSAPILAAADGLVVNTEDGNYDRCHGSLETGENDCDGYPMKANSVTLEHDSGHRTLYWHMMKDSVAVAEGDWVSMGTVLGLVGSSGNSAMPHLHFELEDPDGEVIDPFSGPLSQDESWWCQQGDAEDLPGPCD